MVANKICTLRGLLCYECNDSTIGLDLLDRFGLFHEGVNIVHGLNEAKNAIVAIHLSQDGL
jgi:hypothetical protein